MNFLAAVSIWRLVIHRLRSEDAGQDLVEYALIASFVGVAGYLVLISLGVDIFTAYDSWLDPSVGVPSLWETPPPVTSGS